MIGELGRALKDSSTENNGTSYDMARVSIMFMVITGFPTFLFLCVYSTVKHLPFDMIAFGAAFGSIASGIGLVTGAVAFKQRSDTP